MRLMSFAATTRQMYDRTKTVTRRLDSKGTWLRVLQPGTLVCAVEKGQGIPKGEKVKRIGVIEIVDVRRERLYEIIPASSGPWHVLAPSGGDELAAEGFPEMVSWAEFVTMFCEVNRIDVRDAHDVDVTRIEFRHRPDLTTCCGAARLARRDRVDGVYVQRWECPACGEVHG